VPLALLALPLLGVIFWLHRVSAEQRRVPVAAVFLWRDAVPHSAAAARRARRTDTLWWLRASIALLLIAALAAPAWRQTATSIVVWVDDSLSMRVGEAGGSRTVLARAALLAALDEVGAASATLRSLGDPTSALVLPASDAAGAIDAWFAARAPLEPVWPSSSELESSAEHWLVTDGADPAAATWLTSARVSRVIGVGERGDNAAVTRVAARPSLRSPAMLVGTAEILDLGSIAVARAVELRVGSEVARRWELVLEPGAASTLDFELPADAGALTVALASGDALADDDALELALPPATLPIDVDPTCTPSLAAVLGAHPRLRREPAAALLRVVCGDEPPPAGSPALWIHSGETAAATGDVTALPVWSQAAPAPLARFVLEPEWLAPTAAAAPEGEVWLSVGEHRALVLTTEPSRTLHVLFDVSRETLVHRPEYPALIAALLDALEPATALDPVVSVERAANASRIAPRPLPAAATGTVQPASRTLALQPWLLGAAVLLLIVDALLLARRRAPALRFALGSRLALAVAIVVTLLPVPALRRAAPHDLIVLWDDSASMQTADLASVWDALARVAGSLPAGSRLGLIRFGANTVVEAPLGEEALVALAAGTTPVGSGTLDRSRTNLVAALQAGARFADPTRRTALAIVSDGRATAAGDGAAPGALEPTPGALPSYVLQPPPVLVPPALQLQAPTHAAAQRSVPVDVTLEAADALRGRLTLAVDGIEHASTAVELEPAQALRVRFSIAAAPGLHALRASWRGAGPAVDREAALQIEGETPWLVVTHEPGGAAVAALRAAGWPLVAATPAELVGYAGRARDFAGAVLDDLAIGDLAPSSWQDLESGVTELGGTLLVLGGPRSFGAGGYRHSTLEALLPVTAEATDPQNVSAVLFVVDASGSMARSVARVNPMSYAQRAVLETARTLGEGDEVGLTAFDVEVRTLLPMGRYADPVAALDGAFGALGAAGGTRLRPALQDAFATLEGTRLERRLLVLVSDGFVADEELEAPLAALAAQGTELVVLATGRDADTVALRRLVGAANLFRVEQVSELPMLMRSAVEQRRRPAHEGPTPVRRVATLPGLAPEVELPPLAGFARTRAKPSATVYIETLSGEPVLAAQRAGAGRVVALPAGLRSWASPWTAAPVWPELGSVLDAWLAERGASAYLHTTVTDDERGWRLVVDALDADGEWSRASVLTATLTDAGGETLELDVPRAAPGRYVAALPHEAAGRYLLAVSQGERRTTRVLHRDAAAPRERQAPSVFPGWLARGVVAAAPERAAEWQFSAGTAGALVPTAWLAALLAAFIALLALPRLGARLLAPARARAGEAPR
jgi:hypothetical protein